MSSVAELRAALADDARGRPQSARDAALLGARQAFVKPKQASSAHQPTKPTNAAPSARYGSSVYTSARPQLQRAQANTYANRKSTASIKSQQPPLPNASSKAAAAAAAALAGSAARNQASQPSLPRAPQTENLIATRDRPTSVAVPLPSVSTELVYPTRDIRRSSDPTITPRSRPQTRGSQANNLTVLQRPKSKSRSPSGIAAALAAARYVPSVQPTAQYVELLPASGTVSHVKKWLQSLEGLSPEHVSPLRHNRGPWRPTIVNMPEVPLKTAHLSCLDTINTEHNGDVYDDGLQNIGTTESHAYTLPTKSYENRVPSFQIHSPRIGYTKSVVDTLEETSLDGIAVSNEDMKSKSARSYPGSRGGLSAGASSSGNYEHVFMTTSLPRERSRDAPRRSYQSSRRRSPSSTAPSRFSRVLEPDYFSSHPHVGFANHLTVATSPRGLSISTPLTRPQYSRMDTRSTTERSLKSAADVSSNAQQTVSSVINSPPASQSLQHYRRSYTSTNLSLPQLPLAPLLLDNTGNSLPSRNALLASNIATLRAPSPSKTLPLPSSRKHSDKSSNPLKYFRSRSHTRTPSPAKKLRHTLRKDTSKHDDDEPKAHRRKKLIRKHRHKHNEADRKRWRDTITERERKRYEGLWAANRGLHVYGEPIDGRTEGSSYNPAQAQKVCNLVVRDIWIRSRLPATVLEEIWDLVDVKRDGTLRKEEFVVGMWLVDQQLKGRKLPVKVTQSVWDSVWLVAGVKRHKHLK